MDAFSLLRMTGALLLVLGLLVGALFVVRRYHLTLPEKWLGSLGAKGPQRRLAVIERLALDQRRSLFLLRRDGTEFSVLVGPEGMTVLETIAPARDEKQDASKTADPAPATHSAIAPADRAQTSADIPFAARIAELPEVWFKQEPMTDLH